VTTLSRTDIGVGTRVIARRGPARKIALRPGASSWLPALGGTPQAEAAYTLSDVCVRISCGVATGADPVFVARATELDPSLRTFAYPTLAGRDLAAELPTPTRVMLVPYTRDGRLIPEDRLGALGEYLNQPRRREKLLSRTCVTRKPWYAFHETPPLRHLLRPKLLCKDIGAEPFFVRETDGCLIPRHSTYYLVPADASQLDLLGEFLNSESSAAWLHANCQRAANNYLRLQSHVLKRLPVPEELAVALGASPFACADLAA